MKWPKACLGDAAQVVSGATPKTSVDQYWDGDIPWITPADLSGLVGKEVSATSRRITEAGLSSCSSSILPPRSVLFSSRAPIGHVAINTVPMATNQGFKSFVPNHEILSSDFLYWWLKTNKAYLQSLGRGATFKEVSKEIVETIEIPLPPLDEQRRIAAILDKAESLRSKRSRCLGHINLLLKSAFLDMFGDPVNNPMGWKSGNLVESLDLINGRAFKSSEWSKSGLPIIRIQNVKRPEEDFNRFQGSWESKHLVKKGDILLCWAGQLVSIGVHQWDREDGLLNQHIFKVVPKFEAEPKFIAFMLSLVIEKAKTNFRGTDMKHLTKADLARQTIILPPISIQRRFALFADYAQVVRVSQMSHLERINNVSASLIALAFQNSSSTRWSGDEIVCA